MRENINIGIGGCGVRIGAKFWEVIADEHSLDPKGKYYGSSDEDLLKICDFYEETTGGHYIPRAVLVDSNNQSLNSVFRGPYGQSFLTESLVAGNTEASNIWSKGYNNEVLVEAFLDAVRKQTEKCDCLNGFYFTHSILGGTGSGLGCSIIKKLRDTYSNSSMTMYTLISSPNVSGSVVEPYNVLLSLDTLIGFTDEVHIMDNEKIYDISSQSLKLVTKEYDDINHIISYIMSGISSLFRFPGNNSTDLKKLHFNLTGRFPRLKFLIDGFAPMRPIFSPEYKTSTVFDLIDDLYNPKNITCSCDTTKANYLFSVCSFRGKGLTKEIKEKVSENWSQKFPVSSLLTKNFESIITPIPLKQFKMSGIMMSNSTAISQVLTRISAQIRALLRKGAFIKYYEDEGLQRDELMDYQESIDSLMMEYEQYCMTDNDDDYEEQEGEVEKSFGKEEKDEEKSFGKVENEEEKLCGEEVDEEKVAGIENEYEC